MTAELRGAMAVAVGVHGLLLSGGWGATSATVDVARGPVSFELELFSAADLPVPAQPVSRQERSRDEAWVHEDAARSVPAPHEPSISAMAGQGADSEAVATGSRNRPPAYPLLARLRGWEGVVLLDVDVAASGQPLRVEIARSSGFPMLDAAAKTAVAKWTLRPAKRAGQEATSRLRLPIRFRLMNRQTQEENQ